MTEYVRTDTPESSGPLSRERLRADIAATIQVDPQEIEYDDNLLDLGLDSIRLMILVDRWAKEGAAVEFGALAERPTVEHWWTLVSQALGSEGSSNA
ncbi:MAG TPA: phosphopantetheine-binding protein [Gemmatimonadales bacterium]|nr:phosphopantetheine-binding protein [Gemmatimonadales bacterium]